MQMYWVHRRSRRRHKWWTWIQIALEWLTARRQGGSVTIRVWSEKMTAKMRKNRSFRFFSMKNLLRIWEFQNLIIGFTVLTQALNQKSVTSTHVNDLGHVCYVEMWMTTHQVILFQFFSQYDFLLCISGDESPHAGQWSSGTAKRWALSNDNTRTSFLLGRRISPNIYGFYGDWCVDFAARIKLGMVNYANYKRN